MSDTIFVCLTELQMKRKPKPPHPSLHKHELSPKLINQLFDFKAFTGLKIIFFF